MRFHMSAFEEFLGSKDVVVDPSQLRELGRKAAVAYVVDEVPLNDSIREMAKLSCLTEMQVARVVEFANNDTFSQLFKANFQGNVTFPMADVKAVLGVCAPKTKTASARIAVRAGRYVPGQETADVDSMFCTGMDKVAEATFPERETTKQYLVKQAEARQLTNDVNGLAITFDEGLVRLHSVCTQARREGASADLLGAVLMKTASPKLLSVLAEHLSDVADFGYLGKTAMMGMEPVPSPVTGLVQNLEEVSQQLVVASQQLQQTQISVDGLLSTLRGDVTGAPPDVAGSLGQPGSMPPTMVSPPGMPPGASPGMPPGMSPEGPPGVLPGNMGPSGPPAPQFLR